MWPRTLVMGTQASEPVLTAPSPANFGIENFGGRPIKVALAQTFERQVMRDGDAPPPLTAWPRAGRLCGAGRDRTCCPCRVPTISDIPARSGGGSWTSPRSRRKKPPEIPTAAKPKDPQATGGGLFSFMPSSRPRPARPVGHQLTVARPSDQFDRAAAALSLHAQP